MITDEDKCWLRYNGNEDQEEWVYQHVDGRFYVKEPIKGINSEHLIWDNSEEVYFLTRVAWDWVVDFLKLKGFEPYDPFVG